MGRSYGRDRDYRGRSSKCEGGKNYCGWIMGIDGHVISNVSVLLLTVTLLSIAVFNNVARRYPCRLAYAFSLVFCISPIELLHASGKAGNIQDMSGSASATGSEAYLPRSLIERRRDCRIIVEGGVFSVL